MNSWFFYENYNMRIIFGIIVSVILSLITSVLFPNLSIEKSTINTLFTIAGVLFSVGASLLVTSNASNVPNEKFKRNIRNEVSSILRKFLFCLFVISAVFILLETKMEIPIGNWFVWHISHFLLFANIFAIFYFAINFIKIQAINRRIDDEVNKSS